MSNTWPSSPIALLKNRDVLFLGICQTVKNAKKKLKRGFSKNSIKS